jgi:hypothetical protein
VDADGRVVTPPESKILGVGHGDPITEEDPTIL